jgi:hypothetical protein
VVLEVLTNLGPARSREGTQFEWEDFADDTAGRDALQCFAALRRSRLRELRRKA